MTANALAAGTSRNEHMRSSEPSPASGARATDQLGTLVHADEPRAAGRFARRWACYFPDDPALLHAEAAMLKIEDHELAASFARMSVVFDQTNPKRHGQRIHRAVKASRPNLMPAHRMRDVMWDTDTLKKHIRDGDLVGAKAFLDQPELAGHRFYMPEFRALRHFVLFNLDPEYRTTFTKNCVIVTPIIQTPHPETGADWNAAILDELVRAADWSEKTDTVLPVEGLSAYPPEAERRLRAGTLSSKNFPEGLGDWRRLIESRCASFWSHLIEKNLTQDLFGISAERAADRRGSIGYHINEILQGPVIGPHYHSGTQPYNQAAFPLVSAVFYPKTVPEAPGTRAGYLELGRPNFATAFEPKTLTVRPIAGQMVLFPAFAFHGVIPIDESPRYSVNIDLYLQRKGTEGLSIAGFFD